MRCFLNSRSVSPSPYASGDVLQRMARVLAEGTNADLAEVWLRSGDAMHREAVFPLQPSAPAAVHVDGSGEPSIPRPIARWRCATRARCSVL